MPDKTTGELTTAELAFAKHIALGGMTQSDAYRRAFKVQRVKPENLHVRACKLANHPQVKERIRELLRAASVNDLLSVPEYLKLVQSREQEATAEGNRTAAASYARLMGQTIAALSDKVQVDSRDSDSSLVERLKLVDPQLAELAARRLQAKQSFDS